MLDRITGFLEKIQETASALWSKLANRVSPFLQRLWNKFPRPAQKILAMTARGFVAIWNAINIPMLAVLFGFAVGAIAVLAIGKSPMDVYRAVWDGTFTSVRAFVTTLAYVTPLIFTGLAVAFAFRTGLFNIGAEGQFIVALFVSGYIGFTWPELSPPLLLTLSLLGGAMAGALWAGLPGLLKAKLGVHEVINTIMMNHIAFFFVNWLINVPFKAHMYQATEPVPDAIRLTRLSDILPIDAAQGHTGIFIALAAALACYLVLWRTTLGFEIRATGLNQHAARYAGMSVGRNIILAMLISGFLAGLGGAVQTLGFRFRVYEMAAFPNFGFNGIAVALIGKNHPFGVILAALLFGMLQRADSLIQIQAGVPRQVVAIIQASVIFFVAADQIIKWLFSRRKKEVEVHD